MCAFLMYRSENQGEIIAIMTRNGIGRWASPMGIRVSPSGLSQLSLPGIAHLVEKSHGPKTGPKRSQAEPALGLNLNLNLKAVWVWA